MILFHGSPNIIPKPIYGFGNPKNDYGLGFYCSESLELAKEWACTTEEGGYANQYEFDMSGLNVMNLSDGDYHILNWLAILLENRTFKLSGDLSSDARDYILRTFKPAYRDKDVVIGYRADDSYFSFANAFLNNTISLARLEKAMVLGKLGIQVVPISEKAFERLRFIDSHPADGTIYYPRRMARDTAAREEFRRTRRDPAAENELYMMDILRGRWQNDDPRLQRIILK